MHSENPFVAHHFIASLILTIHQIILKHPHNASLNGTKGIILLTVRTVQITGQQGNCARAQFWKLWRSSIYQLFLSRSTTWNCFTIQRVANPNRDLLKLQMQGYVLGMLGMPLPVHNQSWHARRGQMKACLTVPKLTKRNPGQVAGPFSLWLTWLTLTSFITVAGVPVKVRYSAWLRQQFQCF